MSITIVLTRVAYAGFKTPLPPRMNAPSSVPNPAAPAGNIAPNGAPASLARPAAAYAAPAPAALAPAAPMRLASRGLNDNDGPLAKVGYAILSIIIPPRAFGASVRPALLAFFKPSTPSLSSRCRH